MPWSMGDVKAQRHNVLYTSVDSPLFNIQVSNPGHAKPPSIMDFRTLSTHVETGVNETAEKRKNAKRKRAIKELSALDWHKISVQEALTRLAVSPTAGLDESQAQRRLQQYGKNVISPSRKNMLRTVFGWVFGGFGSLLLVASIICFIAWKPLGGPNPPAANLAFALVLLGVILIQAISNAWQDFSTSRIMASLKGLLPSDVSVLREGFRTRVPAKDLVPGDLVTISMGDRIPADLRLIKVSSDLQFDRGVLTGESDAVSGRVLMTDENFLETKNVALQGTHCVSGSGYGLVVQTGDKTVFGIITKLSSAEQTRMTTLQREIMRFAVIIAVLALTWAVFILIIWAAWLRHSFPQNFNVPTLLITIVSVMVAFIPEGLPIAITLSLANMANILSKKLILCKSLSIVETLGAVNVFCSDKTGTLTQNIMHVDNLAIFDGLFDSESFRPARVPESTDNLLQVVAIGAICNAASFDNNIPSFNNSSKRVISGNATDAAILRFSDSIASADITRQQWINVYTANFSSKTKFMLQLSELSSTVDLKGPPVPPLAPWDHYTRGCFLLTVKGAPEVLMARCSHVVGPSGGVPIPISPAIRERITDIQERWSRAGQRVLLLARRIVRDDWLRTATDDDRETQDFAEVVEEFNKDLIIVGLIGLANPLKPDIKHTVRVCRGAGIRFFIVTGDYPTTALAIAGQAGIITDTMRVDCVTDLEPDKKEINIRKSKSIVITGQQLLSLSSAQMEKLCQYEEIVFARATPEQKLRIVHEFKNRGNIVAVIGDGVNDGPSLKAADCGVAMGAGSDVAKEAADVILLGEFSSIIIAIHHGRLVYDNLKKICIYMMPAGCFSELITILLSVIIGVPQVLGNLLMIVFCVANDMLPALSLSLEGPEHELLLRNPRNIKTERLVDWKFFLQAYVFIGVIDALCASAMAFWYLQEKGADFSSLVLRFGKYPSLTKDLLNEASTVYYITLIIMQWGNLFATRSRRLSVFQHSPTKNIYVFLAPIASLCIAIFFCYVPGVRMVFQTRGIPLKFFFIPLTFSLTLLILDELRKYIVRTRPQSIIARVAW